MESLEESEVPGLKKKRLAQHVTADSAPGLPEQDLPVVCTHQRCTGCSLFRKRICDQCRVAEASGSQRKAGVAALQFEAISLSTEKLDVTGVLNDLYASLEKVVVHLREAVAATFTSRKRLNCIRQEVKAIRSQADRVQEVLLALSKQVEGMTREANTRVALCQDLVVKEVYRELGGPEWLRREEWFSQKPLGEWHGLTSKNGFITKLELNGNALTGMIPGSIGLLTLLEELALAKNSITGPLPPAIGELTYLRVLYLADNGLTGTIPPTFSKLTKLRVLYLSGNKLEGSVPSWLSALQRLEVLGLARNNFTGEVPEELCKLDSLRKLDLSGNQFEGSIPVGITEMTNLEELRLSEGQISPILEKVSPLMVIQRVVPKSGR